MHTRNFVVIFSYAILRTPLFISIVCVCVCVCVQVCVLPAACGHGGWSRQPEGCAEVHRSEVSIEGGAS